MMGIEAKADNFLALHAPGTMLLLANAWDAASARFLASLGAPAVATSSAALAWSHGYPDGQSLPREVLLSAVGEIVRATDVPVSADIERGFGADAEAAAETAAKLIGVGAVGINIEDGSEPAERLGARIEAIRRVAEREKVRFFVNARTDLWLRPIVPDDRRLEEAIRRERLYREAGADGFFTPRLTELGDIERLVAAIRLPLNIMATAGLPPTPALKSAGVRRLSLGVLLSLKAFAALREPTQAFLKEGRLEPMLDGALSFADMNNLFR